MADTKGSALTTLAIDSLDPANDLLNLIDVSDTTMGAGGTNKKMTPKNLISKSLEDLAKTWNNGAVDFTAIKMNVTDTASGSGSLLLDLQVGGASKFKVSKGGSLTTAQSGTFGGGVTANSVTLDNANGYLYGVNSGLYLRFSPTNIQLKTWTNYGIITPENANFWLYDDARIYRDAAHVLAMRNSTNGQEFRLYNTYTDGSNYERGGLRWNSNELQLVTDNAGTGSQRNIKIGIASNPRLTISQSGVSATGNFSHSGGAFTVSTNPTFNATWNNGATVYTGIDLNVTDTASDAASLLMDLRVGGTSKFKVSKTGDATFRDLCIAPSASLTPPNNGDLCIEATNNTTLTFKYKGSDGTVRSGTVALS